MQTTSELWIDRAKTALCTAITIAVVVALWSLAKTRLGIADEVIPTPLAVWRTFLFGWENGQIAPHVWATISAVLQGLGIGVVLGIVVGALVAEVKAIDQAVYPLVIAIQSIPKVALAPLIVAYLGFGLPSKVFTVALLCFFPVFVNTVVGLRSADRGQIEMLRAFSASRLRIFLAVKLPGAADHVLGSLQIAVVLGLIGCIVSEFVAATAGLGYLIKAASSQMDTALMFAAILNLALFGVLLGQIARVLHHRLVFWRRAPGE